MSAEEKQAMNTQEEISTPAPAVIVEAEQAEPVVEAEKKDEKADQPASSSVTVSNETATAKTTKSKKLCFPKVTLHRTNH